MPVITRGRRFAFGIAALAAATLLAAIVGGPSAIAVHYSPGQPSYLKEYPVAGSADNWVASGTDASWVADTVPDEATGGSILRLFQIPTATDDVTSTDVATLGTARVIVDGIAVTDGVVWIALTELNGTPPTPTAKVFKVEAGVGTQVVAHDGFNMTDLAPGVPGTIWFLEAAGGNQTQIGKIDVATSTPTTYPVLTGRTGSELAAGAAADGAVWFIENIPGPTSDQDVTKIARFDPAAPTGTDPITNEYELGVRVPATSPLHGPNGSLWFIEGTATGESSITEMTLTGTPTRHPLGLISSHTLTTAEGALWFTTGFQGNVGRMTPAGVVDKLLCIGSGHPGEISAGPGANVTFTQFRPDDEVGRVPLDATGSPCPRRPVPTSPVGPTKRIPPTPKDTTPAKISLRGKATQRLSKKGTIVVSVLCNEDCTARLQAAVSTGGASKVLRSQRVTRRLVGGKRANVGLKFRKGAVKAIKRTLRKKKRLKVNVSVDTRDRFGNASKAKRTIRLRR